MACQVGEISQESLQRVRWHQDPASSSPPTTASIWRPTFGSFPETTIPRNPPTSPSSTESSSSTSVRSDLTVQSSIAHRVSELDINDPLIVRPRATRRPAISNSDLISGIDRVTRSIVECIQLDESVLGRPGHSAIVPHGLRNNSAVYSDKVRVLIGNLHITELYQSDPEQIQFYSPSPPEAEYQVAVFTLPPNRNSPDGRHQISVVSLDSESFNDEDDQ